MPNHTTCPQRRTRFLFAVLAIGLTAATAPAWGQVIHEDLKLLANDGAGNDRFGFVIDIDNGVVAVGVLWGDDAGDDSGSAYLFDATTGAQLAKLFPSDGAAGDRFGVSIAIDNGIVAVGAIADDDNGTSSGSAYLFDAFTGEQLAKLLPSDGAAGDFFGDAIAIDNGIVAVGARGDSDNGTHSGSAYLFDAATGAQLAKLLPVDGAAWDDFGESIAIDAGVVVVGARYDQDNGTHSGSAYLFEVSTGTQLAKLLPSDGAAEDYFGFSVAISGEMVAVGAFTSDDNGLYSGSAYVFSATTGVQIAKLLPSDGRMGDYFGHSIAVDAGVVGVGARRGSNPGAAYLFDAVTGVQLAKLLPGDGGAGDRFGFSLAIDGDLVVVGADEDDDNGPNSGSAYVIAIDCPADVTRDGVVNTWDFLAFINAWATFDPLADWNVNGTVNTQDFIAYLNDWAAGCP